MTDLSEPQMGNKKPPEPPPEPAPFDPDALRTWVARRKQGEQQTDRAISIATLELLLEIYTLIVKQQEGNNGNQKKNAK